MKNKLRIPILLLSILLINSIQLYSLDNFQINNYKSNIVKNSNGMVQKYSVMVATSENPKNNSDFKEYYINRVEDKYYQKGKIYIKTKVKTDNGKTNLLQAASDLKAQLSAIGASDVQTFCSAYELEAHPEMQTFGLDRIYSVNIPEDKDPLNVCAELMSNPDIEYACPVYIRYTFRHVPNDPRLNYQYGLEEMKLYDAWDITKGSDQVKIAIVDSGFDLNHDELKTKVWKNTKEIPNNGIDDDNNGKIDDVNGWDFVGNTDAKSLAAGKFTEDNDPTNLVNTHGTSVAGCAAAATNNGIGVAGTGYNCKFIPVKAGSNIEGYTGIYKGYEGITYSANLGADIINCSWGGYGFSPAEKNVIDYAVKVKKCVVVCASGNEGNDNDNFPSYPCSYQGVLSVGATAQNSKYASFSNYGYAVHCYAPGTKIYTTEAKNSYTSPDGTSFSSPYVAGIAALVKSVFPTWEPKEIIHQIRSTCRRSIKINNALDDQVYGLVNAYDAVTFNNVQGKTIPGIGIENYLIDGSANASISDYYEHTVSVTIKNYLGKANNLRVKTYSPDNFWVTDTIISVGSLEKNDSVEIHFTVSLNPNTPWSTGEIMLVLRYEDDGYSDYGYINIPIEINTPNITRKVFTPGLNVTPVAASANNLNHSWAVFYAQNEFLSAHISSTSAYDFKFLTYYPISAVCAVSNEKAFFAAYYSGYTFAAILSLGYSETGGIETYNVSSVTGFVNDIYFKDDLNGIFLGDPLNGIWGIGYTNNGGITWNTISTSIIADENETGLVGASTVLGNSIWFGSSTGKLFRSDDFGQNWTNISVVGGQIIKVAFMTNLKGMIVYRASGKYILAVTNDGGNTWKTANNDLAAKGLYPVKIYADSYANSFVIINSKSAIYQTYNEGTTWEPILKDKNFNTSVAAVYMDNNRNVSVYEYGPIVQNVQYQSTKNDAKANLIFSAGSEFIYDSTEVSRSSVKKIKIKNTGNKIANINKTSFKPIKGSLEDFTLISAPDDLLPNEEKSVLVSFTPTSEGEKETKLVVNYDNSATVEITLKGLAYKKAVEAKGNLISMSGLEINFDTIKIGSSKQIPIKFANNGEKDLTVSAINFTGQTANELSLVETLPITVKIGDTVVLNFKYTAKILGDKYGTIDIINNGNVSPLKLTYKAIVVDGSGVNDVVLNGTAKIIPNPAGNNFELIVNEDTEAIELIQIFNTEGKLMLSITPEVNQNIYSVNTAAFPQGNYNVVIYKSKSIESLKLVIVK